MSLINIHCGTLNNMAWLNAADCNFQVDNHVDIWKIPVSTDTDSLKCFLSVMNPDEIARGNRFFQLKDKNRHITTRGALRMLLSKYLNQPPETITFGVTQTDKPYLTNNNPIYFNVSHSGAWILIAVGIMELGVDVEYIKPAFNYEEIIGYNFSFKENRYIAEHQHLNRFFLLWTRKEALLKATGQGLNNDLSHFSCLDGENNTERSLIQSTHNWQISSFKVDDNHWGSLCANPAVAGINFYKGLF